MFPGGRVLFDHIRTIANGAVRRGNIHSGPSLVYHYEDPQAGHYIVEVSSLRFFQVVDTDFLAA